MEAGLEASVHSPMQALLMFEASRGPVEGEWRPATRQASTLQRKPRFETNRGRVEAGLEAGIHSPMQALLVFEASGGRVEAGLEAGVRPPMQALLVFEASGGRVEAGLQAGVHSPMQAVLVFEASGGRVRPETIYYYYTSRTPASATDNRSTSITEF